MYSMEYLQKVSGVHNTKKTRDVVQIQISRCGGFFLERV